MLVVISSDFEHCQSNLVIMQFRLQYCVVGFSYLVQSADKEVATATEQLREAESETKALRSMTQRMILTQEEMVGSYESSPL